MLLRIIWLPHSLICPPIQTISPQSHRGTRDARGIKACNESHACFGSSDKGIYQYMSVHGGFASCGRERTLLAQAFASGGPVRIFSSGIRRGYQTGGEE